MRKPARAARLVGSPAERLDAHARRRPRSRPLLAFELDKKRLLQHQLMVVVLGPARSTSAVTWCSSRRSTISRCPCTVAVADLPVAR